MKATRNRTSAPPSELEPEYPRGTILVVDDEDGPRQAIHMIFKDEYNVLLAGDGPTALRLAQQTPIDVAILDIRMSGMSGLELLERLKAMDPRIEVVMVTAFETTDTLRRALRMHVCDYIHKPFDVATIRAAVQKAMTRRAAQADKTPELHAQELETELANIQMQEQMSRLRAELYAAVLHDLKNTLNIISGFTQMISMRLNNVAQPGPGEWAMLKKYLADINQHVRASVELSKSYLGQFGQWADVGTSTSVNRVLQDLQAFVGYHPSAREHKFDLQPLPQELEVQLTRTELFQLLLNLVLNAFQCTPEPHNVWVSAFIIDAPLDLTAVKETATERMFNIEGFENTPPIAAIQVRDSGPGIPETMIPRIFDGGFSTKGNRGSGLGLSIVTRLVKRARGAIHLYSAEGQGTAITVYLPAGFAV